MLKLKIIFNHEYYVSLIIINLKKVSSVALFSIGLFATAQASAANTYDSAIRQANINGCTAAELKTEDSKLNNSYDNLHRVLNKNEHRVLNKNEKKQLRTVQLPWVDFRDRK